MRVLHVLYDEECGLCTRFRSWLLGQPSHIPFVFVPLQDPSLEERFPGIQSFHPEREIVVVDDEGRVYQGPNAWVLCLWATREYRVASHRLASPSMLPMVRKICVLVSSNRLRLSSLMGLEPERVEAHVWEAWEPECEEGVCEAR